MTLESIFIVMFMLAAIGLATVTASVWWIVFEINRVVDDRHNGRNP